MHHEIFLFDGDEFYQNQLHFVWTYGKGFELADPKGKINSIKRTIKKYGYESAIISLIDMSKHNCITKEQFDIEYGITNNENENEIKMKERNDLSVGEDIETLIKKMKNGEITKAPVSTEPFIEKGNYKESHLLCLLDKDERRKLDTKDENFLRTFAKHLDTKDENFLRTFAKHSYTDENYFRTSEEHFYTEEKTSSSADVPDEEWQKTEFKNLKYSKSSSSRHTQFIDIHDESDDDFEDNFLTHLESLEREINDDLLILKKQRLSSEK